MDTSLGVVASFYSSISKRPREDIRSIHSSPTNNTNMDTSLGVVASFYSSISKRPREDIRSIHSSPTNDFLHFLEKLTEQANLTPNKINFKGAAGCLELGSKTHILGSLSVGVIIGRLNVRNQCSALEEDNFKKQINFKGAAGIFALENAIFGSLSASDMLRLFIGRNQRSALKKQPNFPSQFSYAFMVGSIKFESINAANTDTNNDAEAGEF